MRCSARLAFLVIGVLLVIARTNSAHEFRIETEVLANEDEGVLSQNLTLFSEGYVHDFMTFDATENVGDAPETVVIHDLLRQQVVMIDVKRKVKMTLSREEILQYNAALMAREELRNRQLFLFEPEFENSFDAETGWLELNSDTMTYRAIGEQPSEKAYLNDYIEFADWHVRLNAVDPRKMPPFARLKLNKAIAAQGFIPTRVEMTLDPPGKDNEVALHSKHYLIWKISRTDHKRIEKANEMKVSFREVSVREFQQLPAAVTASR